MSNNAVNKIDPLGLIEIGSGTIHDVAVAEGEKWLPDTRRTGREHSGSICRRCRNGKIDHYATHSLGNSEICYPASAKCNKGDDVVGFWHTHGDSQWGKPEHWHEDKEQNKIWTDNSFLDDFSTYDREFSHGWQLSLYLTTPEGTGRWTPGPLEGSQWDGTWDFFPNGRENNQNRSFSWGSVPE